VIGGWLVVVIVAGAALTPLLRTTTDANFTNKPESAKGNDLIEQRLRKDEPLTETVIVRSANATVDDAAFQSKMCQIAADLSTKDYVVSTTDYYSVAQSATPDAANGMVSADRHTALMQVTLKGKIDDADDYADAYLATVQGERGDGFDVYSVGSASGNHEFNTIAEDDLKIAEYFGLPITLLILIVVFGAMVAAGVPLILALVSITVATGLAGVISQASELSFFVTNMFSMIGLAVGVDYALFIVARYREEREHGADKHEAIAIAGGTASKAVLFSGITVVLALLGMFLIPTSIFRSLGLGAILAVVVAVSAVLTLVPALLSLLGDRINVRLWKNLLAIGGWLRVRLSNPGRFGRFVGALGVGLLMLLTIVPLLVFAGVEALLLDVILRPLTHRAAREQERKAATAGRDRFDDSVIHSGFWGRVTRIVMGHPVIAVVLALALLVSAAIPYFDLKTGQSGVETLPASDVKTGFQILAADFYAGELSPVKIAIDGQVKDPGVQRGVDNLTQQLAANGEFGQPTITTNDAGNFTLIETPLKGDANAQASYDAVQQLRDDTIPAAFADAPSGTHVYVTGDTAFNQDFNDLIDTYTPIVFAFVLGLSFILLLIVFRSLVVPIKAIILNLLSVGAAYGLLVLVFQKGYLAHELGFQKTPTIDAWIPIFLFCVLFGLSMDYHVFLLSRIREHYDLTGRNRESVAVGLQSTARIITGAALIMVVVFSSFAAGRLVSIQQMGFGLAVAVFIDATVIRSVLVPAFMTLLGNANWYLPRWLHWLPDLRVEGPRHPALTPDTMAPEAVPAD
jgi:uncharacterized membrane protein YdfJ with MMPL/SSD domain